MPKVSSLQRARTKAADGLRVVAVAPSRIRAFAGQPRKRFDPAKLAELERSIGAVGQQVPVVVRPLVGDDRHDYELIDGERRLRVVRTLGLPTIQALVREDCETTGRQYVASIVSNFAREGHHLSEVVDAVAAIEQLPEIQALATVAERNARIGAIFGRSAPWVESFRILRRLVPEGRALLDERHGGIRQNAAQMLAVLPAAQQRQLCREITKRRLTADQAHALIRRARFAGSEMGRSQASEPRKGLARLLVAANALAERSHSAVEEGVQVLRRAIQAAQPEQRTDLLRSVDAALENVQALHQVVHRLVKEAGR